jgi:multicomponent Na+:H+ antiporter subunit E
MGITFLVHPPTHPKRWRRIPTSLAALAVYIVILTWDLIMSGIQVARIVLSPSLPVRPGVTAIPSGAHSELDKALSAHAITLTPGEVVIEMDNQGVMYTHCLDLEATKKHAGDAQKLRIELLKKIFG